jgi:signal transduction histidine kinase/ActR/RegA family two-component response regulator
MLRPYGTVGHGFSLTVRPKIMRYGLAVLCVFFTPAVFTIPMVRQGAGTPLVVLFFAILVAAWYGGLGPGLLATALIVVTFLPRAGDPAHTFVRVALFGAVGVMISAMLEAMHAARRRAQDAAREAEAASQAKDRFLAVLSHELRTPLNPVLTVVSSMLDDASTRPDLRRNLEMIQRNVELVARLIDDLLDAVRASKGKLTLNRRPVDAHVLIRQAVEICRDGFDRADVQLRVNLTAASHHVEADPVRFQQVIWNLVQNALKFTPEGGIITVRTRDEPNVEVIGGVEGLVIEIIDTGRGIEPELLPRIFEAFEQGEAEKRRRYAGLGLGLAISRSIAEAHGGILTASSPGAGRGATFTFTLATCPAPPPAARPALRSAASRPARTGLRILLVEDNDDSRQVLSLLLRRSSHEIITANNLESARRAVAEHDFDLLISDIELPDGSGFDLMRELAARGIPGIAMSGFASIDDIRMSREAEFAEHLAKPVSLEVLLDAIGRVASPFPGRRGTSLN